MMCEETKMDDLTIDYIRHIMAVYNLEPIIDKLFADLHDLINLNSTDEGMIPYNLQEYWHFAYGYCKGFMSNRGKVE